MSTTLLLDGAMVLLLLAVIAYAVMLNRKLASLRDGNSALAEMIGSLDQATERADEASSRLRRAAEEGNALLQDSIKQAVAVNESLKAASRTAPSATRVSEAERDLAEAVRSAR